MFGCGLFPFYFHLLESHLLIPQFQTSAMFGNLSYFLHQGIIIDFWNISVSNGKRSIIKKCCETSSNTSYGDAFGSTQQKSIISCLIFFLNSFVTFIENTFIAWLKHVWMKHCLLKPPYVAKVSLFYCNDEGKWEQSLSWILNTKIYSWPWKITHSKYGDW